MNTDDEYEKKTLQAMKTVDGFVIARMRGDDAGAEALMSLINSDPRFYWVTMISLIGTLAGILGDYTGRDKEAVMEGEIAASDTMTTQTVASLALAGIRRDAETIERLRPAINSEPSAHWETAARLAGSLATRIAGHEKRAPEDVLQHLAVLAAQDEAGMLDDWPG